VNAQPAIAGISGRMGQRIIDSGMNARTKTASIVSSQLQQEHSSTILKVHTIRGLHFLDAN
jgi:dihydrodipicolinate reductase